MTALRRYAVRIDDYTATIELLLSDGRASNRPMPDRTVPPEPEDEECDYYAPAGSNTDKDWRTKVGKHLAQMMGLDSRACVHCLLIDLLPDALVGKTWRLSEFPANYQLYTHSKGLVASPRKDHYLYGTHIRRCPPFMF
jgi:hypothetical protein